MNSTKSYKKTRELVLMAVFTAIIIMQTLIPFLGFIPLGIMNATIIQVTVAVGAILLGFKAGAGLGLVFGFASMWKNTFMPNPTSFCFSPFVTMGGYSGDLRSVIICLVPRIMIGVMAYLVFSFFLKSGKFKLGLMLGGAAASITNTILVMGGIYFLFGREYAEAAKKSADGLSMVIVGIIGTQGVPEAIISSILTLAIGGALFKVIDNM